MTLTESEIRTLAKLDALEEVFRTCFEMIRRMRQDIRHPIPEGSVFTGLISPTPPALQVEPPDPDWIPIFHDRIRPDAPPSWPRPCGQVGVYLISPPMDGVNARLDLLRVLVPGESRWRQPTTADAPQCSSCGTLIDPFSNADLDYLSHMVPATVLTSQTGRKGSGKQRPEPEAVISPGAVDLQAGVASPIFPGHTRDAQASVLQSLDDLQKLARDAGL